MPTPRPLPDRFQEALNRNAHKFHPKLRRLLELGLRSADRSTVRKFADGSRTGTALDEMIAVLDSVPAPAGSRQTGPAPTGAARLLQHTDAGQRILARRQGGK